MKPAFLLAAACCALAGAEVLAGPPALTDVVVSEAKDGPAKSTFKPATPKIYLRAKLVDVAPGSKLKADWIAVKAEGAPPNYRIDTVETNVGKASTRYDGSFSKPSAGWPVGDYRVDLSIDGKPATQAAFRVVR